MSNSAAPDLGVPDRFQALWRRCMIDGARDDSAAIHRRLLDGYGEPWRYYHTLEHIEHCIGWFDACRPLVDNPDALELAVWFHDVIYEPGNPDNEAESAKLYLQLSDGVHLPGTRDLVDRLIMATLHLGSSLADGDDARYMVDIDLSSFGLPWEEFLRDSENLRREAASLDDDTYYHKAKSFHDSLLARERFYYTDFFAARLEERARENIRRYLARISG
jgi:predicted metal-dependent HD superfamily phosphohydrolase